MSSRFLKKKKDLENKALKKKTEFKPSGSMRPGTGHSETVGKKLKKYLKIFKKIRKMFRSSKQLFE